MAAKACTWKSIEGHAYFANETAIAKVCAQHDLVGSNFALNYNAYAQDQSEKY